MQFRIKGLLTAVLALAVSYSFAQTQTLDGFKTIRRSAISPIFQGTEVAGYTLFYKSDKADKVNDNYHLDFYDQDLQKVSGITMKKPRNQVALMRNSFNGSAFAFYFYNNKDKSFELESYDTGLKKLGTAKIKEVSKVDAMTVGQAMKNPNNTNENTFGGLNLFPVPNKGFIRNSIEGMGRGYIVEMYDNKLQKVWTKATAKESKNYESIGIFDVTEEYVLATLVTRGSMMSKKMDFSMFVLDAATGKEILNIPVEANGAEQLSLSSLSYDPVTKEFVAIGEYYRSKDKPFVNKSLGMYMKRFNLQGKESGSKFYAWDGELNSKMPASAKESLEKGYVNYLHRIINGQGGKTYIVTEQYKIQASAGGIALTVLNGGGGAASTTEGSIGNLTIFALNSDFTIGDVYFVEKDRSKAFLPPGSGWMSAGLLGHVIKGQGDFDYQFSQVSNDGSRFNVAYINFDKEKGEGTKKIIGNITNAADGKLVVDKIDGTAKATSSFIYPGKPGYLMMVDHLKKEGKLGMKLVKINS